MKINNELAKYLEEGGELGSLAARPPKRHWTEPFECEASDVYARQVAALATRLRRIGSPGVTIGVSGGLDSALCLIVAVGAFERLGLDKSGIHVYTMPGFGTSSRTKNNAVTLCEGLGLAVETIDIRETCLRHLHDIGHDGTTADVTYENAQARMRTLVLMDKANMTRSIVLGTGDLSEIALGWCTYNGDHMSMFGVNSGVPKTVVRKVCAWWARNDETTAEKAMLDIVRTPVSPELVKGQVTEDTLGPYELHDFFIWNFIMNGLDRPDLLAAARERFAGVYDDALVAKTLDTFLRRLVTQAFKRNCAPDGIRIFDFDFSLNSWHIPSDMPGGCLID